MGGGEDESRNKVRNAQQTSPLKKRRDKNLPSMWFYYNFHNFISSSILGGFVLHVLKTCCCRAVSPNPYKEGYSRHQSLGKILQIFSFIKNQNNLFWERLKFLFKLCCSQLYLALTWSVSDYQRRLLQCLQRISTSGPRLAFHNIGKIQD